MGEIVSLLKEPQLWVCACGCSTFEILSDGTARCAACDAPHDVDGSGWSEWVAKSAKEESDTFRDVQGNGSVEFARRRVAQMATDATAALVVVARRDGSVSTWSEAETAEQSDWVRDKLTQAADLVAEKIRGD